MSEAAEESGLHEYIDAEIVIEDLKTPAQEKTLYGTLEKLSGVHKISIKGGKASVNYEPVCITQKEILGAIESAGFHTAEDHSAPRRRSPMPLSTAREEIEASNLNSEILREQAI